MELGNKQRLRLISVKGEPTTQIHFDVFPDGELSMWSTLTHGSDYNEIRGQLLKMRDHLDRFISAGVMCPFCPTK